MRPTHTAFHPFHYGVRPSPPLAREQTPPSFKVLLVLRSLPPHCLVQGKNEDKKRMNASWKDEQEKEYNTENESTVGGNKFIG